MTKEIKLEKLMGKDTMNNSSKNGIIGLGTRALGTNEAHHQAAEDGIHIVGQVISEIPGKRKMVEKARNKTKARTT